MVSSAAYPNRSFVIHFEYTNIHFSTITQTLVRCVAAREDVGVEEVTGGSARCFASDGEYHPFASFT